MQGEAVIDHDASGRSGGRCTPAQATLLPAPSPQAAPKTTRTAAPRQAVSEHVRGGLAEVNTFFTVAGTPRPTNSSWRWRGRKDRLVRHRRPAGMPALGPAVSKSR